MADQALQLQQSELVASRLSPFERALRAVPDRRRDTYGSLIDQMKSALQVLNETIPVLRQVKSHLRATAESAIAASAEPDMALRALLAEDYDDHRKGLEAFAEAEHASALLSPKAASIRVPLASGGEYSIAPFRLSAEKNGLDLPPPEGAFEETKEITSALESLEKAFGRLDRAIEGYGRDRIFLAQRVKALAAMC